MDADCALRSETGYAEFGYFHCYFKMIAPRALVFRLLVKGNEALGTRLGEIGNISIYKGKSFYACSETVIELNRMRTFKLELELFAFIQSIGHLVSIDQKVIHTKTCD